MNEIQETPIADTSRPRWQVWCARAALVIFLILVAAQIIGIARGGL